MVHQRLLFVSSRFLFPADGGGKIRSRDILRGMKGGQFEITLVSPAPTDAQSRFVDELNRVCDRFVSCPEPTPGTLRTIKRCASLISSIPVAVASDISDVGRRTIRA